MIDLTKQTTPTQKMITTPWKKFLSRVIIPSVITIILFVSAFFFVIIPLIRTNSMERKKEMIRELTTSAWNILAKFNNDEQKGFITRIQAQRQAISQIKNLHYGSEMKDYFWINDMTPRMIIHPRADLNGQDLTNFTDPDGKKVFMEIVEVVSKKGSGYVSYQWQPYDNISITMPKISYVKGFAPWGWVLGTGIFIEDINAEIDELIESIILVSVFICVINILLFANITRVSYVTHKKQRASEVELKKTKASLALSEKMASLGTLAAMVAHEINNPLSGILSYAKLSTKYLSQDKVDKSAAEPVISNLSIISSETKRCGEIVKNLLTFAKQSLLDVREVHINEIVTLSTKVIDHSAKMKKLELKRELDLGDDAINCDPGAIQQILVALIVNSLESSSPGKEIIIRTDYSNTETIAIKVIDFGHGIDEKDIPFIFDPFFSTKESNSSLGLGLSAVYGTVEQHGGSISVESKVGKGTTFTIILPREYTEIDEQ